MLFGGIRRLDRCHLYQLYPVTANMRVYEEIRKNGHIRPVSPLQTALYPGFCVSPPIYPTFASSNPFPSKCFRKRCSTPQKQPAATVHFCAFSGMFWAADVPVGFKDRPVEVVKGRRRRLRKLGIAVKAMSIVKERNMRERGVSSRILCWRCWCLMWRWIEL